MPARKGLIPTEIPTAHKIPIPKKLLVTLWYTTLVFSRVASHLFTGSLAGISKLPALAGRYIWFGFLYCKIWGELHFVKFYGNSFFVNSAGTYFSLKRGAWSIKKGAEASL
jgi:hypothetical protein